MTLLLLAGTGEARRLAARLSHLPVIASLAGATRSPAPLACSTRVGGFGGVDGFLRFLDGAQITAVLDATHPFATQISHRTASLCSGRGLPYAHLLRPVWRPNAGDRWHDVADPHAAVALIPPDATVFLATGPQDAAAFAGLKGRVICRRIDPPTAPFPFANGDWLVGRPPFSVADEVALFERLGIDWLVTKNAGGEGARAKLDAARALQVPVAMIARPTPPPGIRFETEDEAFAWVQTLPLAGS